MNMKKVTVYPIYKMSRPILMPNSDKKIGEHIMHITKIGSRYAVILRRIFNSDPIDMQLVVSTKNKIKSFIKEGYILQAECPYKFN